MQTLFEQSVFLTENSEISSKFLPKSKKFDTCQMKIPEISKKFLRQSRSGACFSWRFLKHKSFFKSNLNKCTELSGIPETLWNLFETSFFQQHVKKSRWLGFPENNRQRSLKLQEKPLVLLDNYCNASKFQEGSNRSQALSNKPPREKALCSKKKIEKILWSLNPLRKDIFLECNSQNTAERDLSNSEQKFLVVLNI